MAAPVWSLSVNLETKTATFTSGLADAAKKARGSFDDIKDGAKSAGKEVGVNMFEARHGVMLLGEEFGIHLPRALTAFVTSLGPIGAAMEAAFPFLAIIVGATLLYQHIKKIKEAGEELTESQVAFGTTVQNVLNGLNDRLLQAGIKIDDLNGNHLAALEKQLQLIDHATMNDLVQELGKIAKAADEVFKQIDESSFALKHFGGGAEGAKDALTKFKTEYANLIAQGKADEANGLLSGTLDRAKQVLALQEQANKYRHLSGGMGVDPATMAAVQKLAKENIADTDGAVAAQKELVDVLQAQVNVQGHLNAIKKLETTAATQTAYGKVDADQDKMYREQAQSQQKAIDEQDRLDEENYNRSVSEIQENERLKIAATRQGTAARLEAIDAAIKDENSKGLQETGYYKSLLTDRVNTAREMADEEARVKADAGKQDAEHELRMGELMLAADRNAQQLALATKQKGNQARLASDQQLADMEYQLKQDALNKEMAALDKAGKDYENKLRALQNRQTELIREHENQVTEIRTKAAIDRAKHIADAEQRLDESIAHGLTSTLMRQQTFAQMMGSLGNQIVSGMLQTAIQSALMEDFGKEKEAAHAARLGFIAGMKFPWPANIVMAPALGAMAFASVMAFNAGGMVPGVDNFDSVNARLTPGETVIPKQMTERLNRAAEGGDSKPHVTIHHSPTYHVQTIDGDGIRQTLTKHKEEFSRHVNAELRRMNR